MRVLVYRMPMPPPRLPPPGLSGDELALWEEEEVTKVDSARGRLSEADALLARLRAILHTPPSKR